MTGIVTFEEAKLFLRVTHDDEDSVIALMIAAATEAVLEHANNHDAAGPVPARLKAAALARCCILYDERDSVRPGEGEDRLLSPLRRMTLWQEPAA